MAARLAPHDVGRMHQSLHHLVADAPWNDEEMLAEVRREVLPAMQKNDPVVAWIIDDGVAAASAQKFTVAYCTQGCSQAFGGTEEPGDAGVHQLLGCISRKVNPRVSTPVCCVQYGATPPDMA